MKDSTILFPKRSQGGMDTKSGIKAGPGRFRKKVIT